MHIEKITDLGLIQQAMMTIEGRTANLEVNDGKLGNISVYNIRFGHYYFLFHDRSFGDNLYKVSTISIDKLLESGMFY